MALRTLPLLLLFASSALAQTTGTATIVGAVTDSTGSVVAGAKITVVNVNTSFVHNSVTTPEGTYYIPNLNPGTYQLTIEATGFRTHVRDGIILRTAEQPRLDVQLEVGTMAESVQVTAAAPLLETETAAAGQVLEGWDPDGRRIAFISRRSGKVELWIINRDGSGLEQITHTQNRGSVMYPQWSPDGSRLGYYVSDEGSYLLDAGKPWKEQTPQALPAMSNESFAAYAWSPDGRKIAGLHSPRPDASSGLTIYSLESRGYEKATESGLDPVWLSDSRRLLFLDNRDTISLIDSQTKKAHPVYSVAPATIRGKFALSRDDRVIYLGVIGWEADIWLANPQ